MANIKEILARLETCEARIQTDPIPVFAEQINNLGLRIDRVVEGFEQQLAMRDVRISEYRDHQDGMNDTLFGAVEEIKAIREKLDEITAKVEGRNKSAAVKRNMTDADAERVLTGDLQSLAHKEAAEQIGLTYAQVYSCRMEFTFKHVHKSLRDLEWKNPWTK